MDKAKKAIIISIDNNVTEIQKLTDSLGYKTIKIFVQNKSTPDVNYYIGCGKLEEIKKYITEIEDHIDLIVINGALKPSQWFNLEKEFKIKVYDRITLILSIFEKRADRKEARLQVKLAQLQYQRSFVKELIHRSRAGEHPGYMAGGEYQVDDYYEYIKKQMKKIKNDLKNIRNEREIRRRHRHLSGFYLVSLAGYTNAGKSSLLNLLSGDKVKVEDKLFSTLSTTTRRVNKRNIPILLTDTVGFIEDLPGLIINAFHSTLEEIKLADVVVLVVDFSENSDTVSKKLKISFEELAGLGVEAPIVIALNKIDLLSKDEIDYKLLLLENLLVSQNRKYIPVSVNENINIDNLLDIVYKNLPKLVRHTIKLPLNDDSQKLISDIYKKTNVCDINYGDLVTVTFECKKDISSKILSDCKEINGQLSS